MPQTVASSPPGQGWTQYTAASATVRTGPMVVREIPAFWAYCLRATLD